MDHPPFEPSRRDGNLYARGATDDKGQMFTHLKSAEAWITVEGRLPMNLKFIIEGEEEVGSHGLEQYLAEHADRLACDCVVISDGGQFAPGVPAITYGLRGIAYYELHVTRPQPRSALRLVRRLGDQSGQRPGPDPRRADRSSRGESRFPASTTTWCRCRTASGRKWRRCPSTKSSISRRSAWSGATGEEGYTALERRWARPTFDISGLWGGYQGEGAKTVLPASAGAKFSFRLVPNQDPAKITAGLKRKLTELCPPGVELELIEHHGAPGVLVPLDSPYVEAAARAIEHAFGRRPVFTREGGSIPIVTTFHQQLKADTLLLGWGQDDDNTHSPNEKFSLADFHRGIKASARLWEELSKVMK